MVQQTHHHRLCDSTKPNPECTVTTVLQTYQGVNCKDEVLCSCSLHRAKTKLSVESGMDKLSRHSAMETETSSNTSLIPDDLVLVQSQLN